MTRPGRRPRKDPIEMAARAALREPPVQKPDTDLAPSPEPERRPKRKPERWR